MIAVITGEFVHGHAQQNGEQLNNLLKTLHDFYLRPVSSSSSNPSLRKLNQGEFIGYFIIFQIGNGGEVTKYLQRLPPSVLQIAEIRFAISVWSAIRTENYAQFFKLLKQANVLQACLMHRYIGNVRLQAMKKLCRTWFLPTRNPDAKTLVPITDIVFVLFFETSDECVEFLTHCGIDIVEEHGVLFAAICNQNIDSLLPRDKNNKPILPTPRWMPQLLNVNKIRKTAGGDALCNTIEICRGFATNSAVFGSSDKGNVKLSPPKVSFAIPSPLSMTSSAQKTTLMNKLQLTGSLGSTRQPVANNLPIATPTKSTFTPTTNFTTPGSFKAEKNSFVFTPSPFTQAESIDTIPKAPAVAAQTFQTPVPPKILTQNPFTFPSPVTPAVIPSTAGSMVGAFYSPGQVQTPLQQSPQIKSKKTATSQASGSVTFQNPSAANVFQWNTNAPAFNTSNVGSFGTTPNSATAAAATVVLKETPKQSKVSTSIPVTKTTASPSVKSMPSPAMSKISVVGTAKAESTPRSVAPKASPVVIAQTEDSDEVPDHILKQINLWKKYRVFVAWRKSYRKEIDEIGSAVLLRKTFSNWRRQSDRVLEKRETFVNAIESISICMPPKTPPQYSLKSGQSSLSSQKKKQRSPLRMFASVPYVPRNSNKQHVVSGDEQIPQGLLSCFATATAHNMPSSASLLFVTYLHYALLTLQTQRFLGVCQSSHQTMMTTSKKSTKDLLGLTATIPLIDTSFPIATNNAILQSLDEIKDLPNIHELNIHTNHNLQVMIHKLSSNFTKLPSSLPSSLNKPSYPDDVYFKLVVCSPSARAGMFTNVDCYITTMLRAFLCNGQGYFSNFSHLEDNELALLRLFQYDRVTTNSKQFNSFQLGLFASELPLVQINQTSTLQGQKSTLHMSIVECVGDKSAASALSAVKSLSEEDKQSEKVQRLQGSQANLIVVSEHYFQKKEPLQWDTDYLHYIQQSLSRRLPIVLFVVVYTACETDSVGNWEKIVGYPASSSSSATLKHIMENFESQFKREDKRLLQLLTTTTIIFYAPSSISTATSSSSITTQIPLLQFTLQSAPLVANCRDSLQETLGSLFWEALLQLPLPAPSSTNNAVNNNAVSKHQIQERELQYRMYENITTPILISYDLQKYLLEELVTLPRLQQVSPSSSSSSSYEQSLYAYTYGLVRTLCGEYCTSLDNLIEQSTQAEKELAYMAQDQFYLSEFLPNCDNSSSSLPGLVMKYDPIQHHYSPHSLPQDWQTINRLSDLRSFLTALRNTFQIILSHKPSSSPASSVTTLTSSSLSPKKTTKHLIESDCITFLQLLQVIEPHFPSFQSQVIHFLTSSPSCQPYSTSLLPDTNHPSFAQISFQLHQHLTTSFASLLSTHITSSVSSSSSIYLLFSKKLPFRNAQLHSLLLWEKVTPIATTPLRATSTTITSLFSPSPSKKQQASRPALTTPGRSSKKRPLEDVVEQKMSPNKRAVSSFAPVDSFLSDFHQKYRAKTEETQEKKKTWKTGLATEKASTNAFLQMLEKELLG